MIKAALYYQKMGFSVVPIVPQKKAPCLVKWKDYQSQMATIEQITEWWTKWPDANIGIVTGAISNLCVVDIDKYKETYNEELTLEYFPDNIETPTVSTPQGGIHLYFRPPEDHKDIAGNVDFPPAVDFRAEGNYIVAPPSKGENGAKYSWNDILSISKVNLAYINNKYISFIINNNNINSSIHAKDIVTGAKQSVTISNIGGLGTRDNDLFHLANHLVKGNMPVENIRKYLQFFASNCNPPFTEKETEIKILSALDREKTQEKSFAEMVREWVCNTDVTISQQMGYNALQCVTRNEKAKLRVYLQRLADEGIIKKIASGKYKRVEGDVEWLDIEKVDTTAFDIKWPFQIEQLVKMPRGSLALVAGQQGAGKTAFLLNLAKMNINKNRKIIYLSSETNAQGLNIRCSGFAEEGITVSELNKGIQFGYKSDNMVDAIDPDAINILDYLEVMKDFWEVGGLLSEIFKKVTTGVAIVGIQMHGDKPLGGAFGFHKPEIVLTLKADPPNSTNIKIEKARWWAQPDTNPRSLVLPFRIRHGCLLRQLSEWEYEKK